MPRAALLLEESVRTLEQRLTKLWSKAWANSWSSFIPWRYHGARVIWTYQYLSLPNTPDISDLSDISDISAWWISWVTGESVEISWYIMLWHPHMNSRGIFMMLLARPRNPFAASNWQLLRLATVHGIVCRIACRVDAEATLSRARYNLAIFFDLRRKITGK